MKKHHHLCADEKLNGMWNVRRTHHATTAWKRHCKMHAPFNV